MRQNDLDRKSLTVKDPLTVTVKNMAEDPHLQVTLSMR